MTSRPPRSVLLGVALLSGAALAYEILLIRLFAIIEWHHLSFLVISLALLGYGASGTWLAFSRAREAGPYAAAFGLTSIASFIAATRLEFNSLEIIWSRTELAKLVVFYLLFAVPFFCAATAIGLTLMRFGEAAPRVYAADLIGGGVSVIAVTALLFAVHPVTALQIVACGGFVSAALWSTGFSRSGPAKAGAPLFVIAGLLFVLAARPLLLPLQVSQFKELPQALRIPGARVVEERSSPLALLTVVESPQVPLRYAPGLSLNFPGELPAQAGVFSDAGSLSVITKGSSAEHFDFVPSAAPYHLRRSFARVAIVGAGGGAEVLSALAHGARSVAAIELNPQMIEIAGSVYRHPRVRVVNAEARRFLRDSTEKFDLIQIALVDSFGASTAGVHSLSESYLYTVEALAEMLGRLEPGGYLVITRWMQVPPRDIVKLTATAAVVLEGRGQVPWRSIALVRTWNTASLIVKAGALHPEEVAALRRFCDDRSFDLDFAPGVRKEETNRYNILDEPSLFDMAASLSGGERTREELFRRYKFHIRPATDDRPYFFHFFRWEVLPELLRMRGRGGMPLVEWGYVIVVAALGQALVAAVVFLLLPLLLLRRVRSLGRVAMYFGAIGLAFLFLEIAFIQRLTLFLGHPLYAAAVVLSSFLVFAGIGSGLVDRVRQRWGERTLRVVPVVVALIALAELPLLRALLQMSLGFPTAAKVAISVAIVAPLALFMGMPFPSELQRLAARDSDAVPWAWGINGTASVMSSMLATLLAVHFGFSAVVVGAAALYVLAAVAAQR